MYNSGTSALYKFVTFSCFKLISCPFRSDHWPSGHFLDQIGLTAPVLGLLLAS